MTRLALLLTIGFAPLAFAELPDFYRTVDRMSWVVADAEVAARAWSKLGVTGFDDHGVVPLDGLKYRGGPAPSRVRIISTRFGSTGIDWIQPVAGHNAFSEYLAESKGGVLALMHRVPSVAALEAEVDRMKSLGVTVLQRGLVPDPGAQFVYFDTRAEGKYSLAIYYDPNGSAAGEANPSLKITQFAFVVHETGPVSAYWEKLGFPKMTVTHSLPSNRVYRGAPGHFEQNLGWQRHGKVPYEWCQALKGPTAYEDHIQAHGEGFHHIGVNVGDMDAAIRKWTELGVPVIQSGAWGEEGKPGSGRFAYLDTDSFGGISVELLWSYR